MRTFLLFLLCMNVIAASAQLLIRNTSILDVEKKRVLAQQDLLIENGVIAAIGKKLSAPAGITEIDGSGKWLMPGFVDAHVHFFQSGGVYTRPDAIDLRKHKPYEQEIAWTHHNMESFLRRYIAAGITSVIDVGSTLHFLKQRDSFRNKPYAPTVYMTGPLLTTWEPQVFKGLKEDEPFYEMKTPDQARAFVQAQLPYKPDFVKIWYIVMGQNTDSAARLHLPLVQAVIDESHKHHLRVAVHATERITAQLAVEAGADLLVHGIDDSPVDDAFVQLLKKKKVVLSPTLVVADGYRKAFGQTYNLTGDQFQFAHPTPVNSILDFKHLPDTAMREQYRLAIQAITARAKAEDSLLRFNFKKLVDGGVIIATGTDAGNIGTQHVSSFFEELAAMQQSGMNLWQLIQASTINGARAVGREAEFGSIAKGKRADLVLLTKNPLDSITNWKSIDVIINKGVAVKPDSVRKLTPVELADQQLLAYNAHNLEAFLAPYADDIEVYDLSTNKLRMKGIEDMRKNYRFLNRTGTLHCHLLNRIVQADIVIDHEEIITDKGTFYGVAIYEIQGGKIRKVWFPE
jgi:imidazolonepropionase-like amidohydrolase